MTSEELLRLLKSSESSFVERKQSLPNGAELRKTLVAFANSMEGAQKGVLFLGVSDSGAVHGITNADEAQKKVREVAERDCYPPIVFSTQMVSTEGKEVIAVIVPMSRSRPHFTGHAFVRTGSECVKASSEMLELMIASRNEKAGKIIGHIGKPITVSFLGLQGHATLENGKWRTKDQHAFRVTGCDAHCLDLLDEDTGTTINYSLERIQLSFDLNKNRIHLTIDERN